jgi:hypothetical protein
MRGVAVDLLAEDAGDEAEYEGACGMGGVPIKGLALCCTHYDGLTEEAFRGCRHKLFFKQSFRIVQETVLFP